MTPLEKKTFELDQLIDRMLEAVTEIGSDAHRKLVQAVCDCIEPLITKRFSHHNREYIATVRRWVSGEIESVSVRTDCHNSVHSLQSLCTDERSARHALHCALYDGPDDAEFEAELPRFCSVIRRYFPDNAGETTLLLVEDDSTLRHIIAENLRARGYAVMAVADGWDALAEFGIRNYDVVVSDYHMPGMYGDKLRDRIYQYCDKNRNGERPVFVIMSGAWAGAVSAASGFIAKPFDQDVLHGVIQSLLAARSAA